MVIVGEPEVENLIPDREQALRQLHASILPDPSELHRRAGHPQFGAGIVEHDGHLAEPFALAAPGGLVPDHGRRRQLVGVSDEFTGRQTDADLFDVQFVHPVDHRKVAEPGRRVLRVGVMLARGNDSHDVAGLHDRDAAVLRMVVLSAPTAQYTKPALSALCFWVSARWRLVAAGSIE